MAIRASMALLKGGTIQTSPILVCTVGNPQHKPFPSTFAGIAREQQKAG